MKHILCMVVIALFCNMAIAAPVTSPVRAEIDALLDRLQASGCQFNRNGSWYSGSEARDHLLRKLEYFEGKAAIQSAEQFIDLAASRSSLSGLAYQVKCADQPAMESQLWLNRQLAAIRQSAARRKP